MAELLIENIQSDVKITSEIENIIKKCAEATLNYEHFGFNAEISVTICDEEEIRRLNSEYRNKNSVTDVLSFPMFELDEITDFKPEFEGENAMLGDIVICAKRASEQAEEYGHTFIREIAFLTVHSMLHLLGYDHEHSDDEEQEMFKRQKEILNKMGITRD